MHYIDHLEQCHRQWYGRARAHPEILAELHDPRSQLQDQEGDEPVSWIDALNERLCALEEKAQVVARATGPGIIGEGRGGSSRPPVTLRQTQSGGGSTVPVVVPPLTYGGYLESVYGPDSAREGFPTIGAHQSYYTSGAGHQAVPPFGADDPSYHAPDLRPSDSSVIGGGGYQSLYGTDLAREAMGPPPMRARLPSRLIPMVAPNVTPNESDAGDVVDDPTPE